MLRSGYRLPVTLPATLDPEGRAATPSHPATECPQRPERPRRLGARAVLGRIAALLLGVLTPLILFEVALRVGGAITPGEYQTVDLNAASETFGRLNMANRSGAKQTSEFSTHVRVNSRGLRGPEIPYAKPAGTYRVLVIGDSFTFGAQVEEDQTFVARLGEYLRAEADRVGVNTPEIETINAGVDGWNTHNELAWLKAEGVRYDPDLVILMYYTGNDPGENFDWAKALKRNGVNAEPDPVPTMQELRKSLAGASAVYTLFETGVVAKLVPLPAQTDLDTSPVRARRSMDPDRKERGWEISGDLISQLRQFSDDRDFRLVVVGIPTVEHVMEPERSPTPIVAIARNAGADVVDLLEPFQATSSEFRDTLYFPKDKHWTPTGHALAAEHVAAEIVDSGFLGALTRSR